jgi:hypothetical protein
MRYRYNDTTDKMEVWCDKAGKWKPDKAYNGRFDYSKPMNVMLDIGEFVAHATDKPVLISSRSKLAAYERSNGVRQAGDFRRGEIAERRQKKVEREIEAVTKRTGIRPGNGVTWSDFS